MTRHAHKAGTHSQPKPMTSAEVAKTQAPGPAGKGFRSPRPPVNNRFNRDPHGSRSWNKLTKGL